MKTWLVVLACILLGVASCAIPPSETWIDIAKSHTGQDIAVRRKVEFHFGSGELTYALQRWPNKFSFEFQNPATGQTIAWQGEKYVLPVLLDVVNGSAWLVVTSNAVYSDVEKYGCPEIDYVFLTYNDKRRRWIAVEPSKAPPELRTANLSYGYAKLLMPKDRVIRADEIEKRSRSAENSTSGHFSEVIPRTFAQWTYKYKTSSATKRTQNDCRAPLEQPIDYIAATGPSTQVSLEAIESGAIDPEQVIPTSLWAAYYWDKERALACNGRLKTADDQDQRLITWQRFVRDTSRKRVFPNSHSWLCDADAVWVLGNRMTEPGRFVLTRTTSDGEILYKASFATPPALLAQNGTMRMTTLQARDGYVYFEWISFDSGGQEMRIKHSAKFRFQEPAIQLKKP